MASKGRTTAKRKVERVPKPAQRIFFLNGRLVKFIQGNRAANTAYIWDYLDKTEKFMLLSDFKKHRKRAYSVANACRILDRNRAQFNRMIMAGMIKRPISQDGVPNVKWNQHSYYSEDDLFEIRAAMATIHRGRPRKDGRITTSRVLTEQELRAKMGDALVLYTRKSDGTFVPVWAENTY